MGHLCFRRIVWGENHPLPHSRHRRRPYGTACGRLENLVDEVDVEKVEGGAIVEVVVVE